MTTQIALTLAIIAGALVLFGTEKLRVDVVALIVLLTDAPFMRIHACCRRKKLLPGVWPFSA